MSDQPYDFGRAREAAAAASAAQYAAETFARDAAKDFAHREEAYRVALAKRIVELHAEGTAWSVCGDVARGDTEVARLRRERDIAEGVREAAQQACWRRSADRKDTQSFIRWSQARDLAEGYGTAPEPAFEPVIGGRRAA